MSLEVRWDSVVRLKFLADSADFEKNADYADKLTTENIEDTNIKDYPQFNSNYLFLES